MKGKFDHYWRLCNLVFAVAAVLDPRLKFKIVEVAYDGIYGRESQAHLSRFRKFLTDVYYEYEYANIKPRNLTTSSSVFGEFSSSTRQSTQIEGCILDSFRKHASASNSNEVAPWKSELDRYLEEPSLPLNEESFFDILCWWRDTSERFPTLGRMARDFLVMPVSVVAPCSDFSAMILNPSYSRLNPKSMEALKCTQNWLEMPKGNGRDNYAPMENKMVTLPLENVLQEGKPLKSSPKWQYIHCFPLEIHEYIHSIIDVKADGHCGFRSIAGLLGMGSDCWSQVRHDLIEELHNFQEHYVSLYGSIEHVDELLQAISWFETPAPHNKWMAMPDMGHLIASRYNVVLVHISTKQCLTFLPLRSVPCSPPEHKIIVIGFVNNNHFVQVLMDPVSPIPSIAPEWRKHRYHCAREWESPYIARIEAFKSLCAKNSNVTCPDTIYLDVP